jgi:Fur family ferric uptake transcriptional regulator
MNQVHPPGETRLRATGKRVTTQRRLVLDVLSAADGHLDASEIYERAHHRDPRLSLATVYRTLKALGESGVVRQLHLAGERHYYELDRQDRHAHLVCAVCGRVWEVDSAKLSQAAKEAGREFGFQVTTARVEVIGLCATCRQQQVRDP